MKTKTHFILLVTLLTIGMMLTVHSGGSVLAQPIELRLATYGSEEGAVNEGCIWFKNELEKRTNGKVTVKIFFGESLAKITELPRAIKGGLADMGPIVAVYHPELFPYGYGASQSVLILAGLGIGDWIKPYRQLMDEFPEVRDVYRKQNQKLIAFWEAHKIGVLSRKPIRNFADAKGVKIRTSGEYLPRFFKAAGFNPVSIPATEAYDALSRGLVDAIHAQADTVYKYRWYETCKYLTETPIFGTALVYPLTINLDRWNTLPKNVQEEMVKIGDELTVTVMPEILRRIEDVDLKARFENAGGTFLKFDDGDTAKWRSRIAKSALEYYISRMEEKKIPRIKEIVYRYAELVKYKMD